MRHAPPLARATTLWRGLLRSCAPRASRGLARDPISIFNGSAIGELDRLEAGNLREWDNVAWGLGQCLSWLMRTAATQPAPGVHGLMKTVNIVHDDKTPGIAELLVSLLLHATCDNISPLFEGQGPTDRVKCYRPSGRRLIQDRPSASRAWTCHFNLRWACHSTQHLQRAVALGRRLSNKA